MKKSLTVSECMKCNPCERYPESRVVELWAGRDSLTPQQVAELDISPSDRLWCLLQCFDVSRGALWRWIASQFEAVFAATSEADPRLLAVVVAARDFASGKIASAELARGFSEALTLARALTLALDRDRALTLTLALDRDRALTLTLARALTLALDRDRALALDRDRALALDRDRALALALDLDRAREKQIVELVSLMVDELDAPPDGKAAE